MGKESKREEEDSSLRVLIPCKSFAESRKSCPTFWSAKNQFTFARQLPRISANLIALILAPTCLLILSIV